MTYRAKAFPYPLLASFNDDYPGVHFAIEASASIDESSTSGLSVEIEFEISLSSDFMSELLIDKDAAIYVDVDSRSTLLRQYRRVEQLQGKWTFEEGDLLGDVTLTPLIVALHEVDLRSTEMNDEFGEASFPVRKGDILSIGDAVTIDIDFARTLARDLVIIQRSEDLHADVYEFLYSGPRIIIRAGTKAMDAIERMRADSSTRPYIFMSVYKDCFAGAIEYLSNEGGADTDLLWGKTLLRRLERVGGSLTSDVDLQQQYAQRLVAELGIHKVEVSHD